MTKEQETNIKHAIRELAKCIKFILQEYEPPNYSYIDGSRVSEDSQYEIEHALDLLEKFNVD